MRGPFVPLNDSDLEILQAVLLALHEERDLDRFRAEAPKIVLRAVPGDYFVWTENGFTNRPDPLRNLELFEHPPRMSARSMKRLLSLLDEHPFTLHARATGDWGPVKLSDFWTEEQLKASVFWKEVYREHGTGRLMACAVFRGNRFGTINVSRPLEAPDFDERDREMMRLVTPHFVMAHHAAERITSMRGGGTAESPALGLTAREIEVGRWLARGRTNPEIAKILAMQPRTVEKHVERILLKLGVENRTTAAVMIAGRLPLGSGAESRSRPERPARRPKSRTTKPSGSGKPTTVRGKSGKPPRPSSRS